MRPVHVDGAIFVAIAVTMGMVATLGSDDAAKYIEPRLLFFLKNLVGWSSAGLLALKMFRSQSYARDKDEQETGVAVGSVPVVVEKKKES